MANVAIEDLLKRCNSVYRLVILAAKRAKEVAEGAPPLIETHQHKVTTVALDEILRGKVLYKPDESEAGSPKKGRGGKAKAFVFKTGIGIPEENFGGKLTFLIGILGNHDTRNELIAGEIEKAVRAGRRALVLSHRRNHLSLLREMVLARWGEDPGLKIGWYVGGITEAQIDEAATCNLLFGTYQYAKEALDDPSMDTLFLATPVGDAEQPVGRILRACAGKKEPFVIDFIDEETKLCKGFGESRVRQYDQFGFPVTEITPEKTDSELSP